MHAHTHACTHARTQAGVAYFPEDPTIRVLHAIVLMELLHDPPAGRSQLQVGGDEL